MEGRTPKYVSLTPAIHWCSRIRFGSAFWIIRLASPIRSSTSTYPETITSFPRLLNFLDTDGHSSGERTLGKDNYPDLQMSAYCPSVPLEQQQADQLSLHLEKMFQLKYSWLAYSVAYWFQGYNISDSTFTYLNDVKIRNRNPTPPSNFTSGYLP